MSTMEPSSDDTARIAELERQMQEATRRLDTLEHAAARPGPAVAWRGTGGHGGEVGLRGDGPGEPGGEATVSYAGGGQFGPLHMVIRQRATLPEVFAAQPESVSRVFAALASPARLAVLRALVEEGPRTSQQLREVLDDPSAGQLYHHLRELLAAGLVIQPSRSVYAIPPGKVVAVCVAVTAATHLTSTSHHFPPPLPGPEEDEAQDEPRPGG